MKRIASKELKQLYGPVPEETNRQVAQLLARLPDEKPQQPVRHRLPMLAAAALTMILLAAGAVAAVLNWDAVRFLYGGEKPEVALMQTNVEQKASAAGVTLNITTALTDGYALAMDWSLAQDAQEQPVYLQLDELTINDEAVPVWSVDGLNCLWLSPDAPQLMSGDVLMLPQPADAGGALHVELRLGVYRPREQVTVFMDTAHAGEAQTLRDQGLWAVEPIFAGRLAGRDQPEREWRFEARTEEEAQRFDRSEIALAFDVPVPLALGSAAPMHASQTVFEDDGFTLTLMEAVRTPLGVYATLEIVSDEALDMSDAAVLAKIRNYQAELTAPWDVSLYGRQLMHGGSVTADSQGRLHRVVRCGLTAYQDKVVEELQAVSLNILHSSAGLQHRHSANLYLDASAQTSYTQQLKPVQQQYDSPLYSAVYESITKSAGGSIWFELLITPKTDDDLAKLLQFAICNAEGVILEELQRDMHCVTEKATDARGKACLRVKGTVFLPVHQPEEDVLALKLTAGEDELLLPFRLYAAE